MNKISTATIKDAVYKLCFEACTCLDESIYSEILSKYETCSNEETKSILKSILQNAKIAFETKKPLCQDTGQVIVFVEIGNNVVLTGDFIEDEINSAISKCYKENYFRKSAVKNAIFDRTNTNDNTPAIIYTKYVKGDEVKISVLIKGAGSENKSKLEMMLPGSSEKEITEKCGEMILNAGENSCPPMFIGIGAGGTAEKACLMSKEAFISDFFTTEEINLARKIKEYVNEKSPVLYGNSYVLDVKLKTASTHIACLPVAVTVNCHSDRVSKCIIKESKIEYLHKIPDFRNFEEETADLPEINASETDKIRNLKKGEKFLLSGEIYTARDAAHKKLVEMTEKKEKLPFDIKDKIIFYAGPCPVRPCEASNSTGPTTASRIDKYAEVLYKNGLFASIGKGSRSSNTMKIIDECKGKYLTATGGIAALLSEKIIKSELIAFEELGTEAIYKLTVKKLPVKVYNDLQ